MLALSACGRAMATMTGPGHTGPPTKPCAAAAEVEGFTYTLVRAERVAANRTVVIVKLASHSQETRTMRPPAARWPPRAGTARRQADRLQRAGEGAPVADVDRRQPARDRRALLYGGQGLRRPRRPTAKGFACSPPASDGG